MRIGPLLFALFALVSGVVLGNTYIPRLPNHDGYWLVPVDDHVEHAPPRPPKLVLIVVDGLRRDRAETMKSARRLAERGQCRSSDQGDYTVSRPVYSLLSTGLEADRSGSRNNDLESPLAAESFWEVARKAGLRVRGSSHLPWWQELFPRGFDAYRHTPNHAVNVFDGTREEDARFDVDLFHPLYVDEMGHQHGARSPEYAAAVRRVDAEIEGLFERLDLERTNVILTADHGHLDGGGHGGEQREIREVLACFAGPGIRHADGGALFDGRLTAPLMSLLAGVPFPAHMRAGEDHLDDLWSVAELEPAFEADRRAAIARFREANAKQLEAWLGGEPATWSALYARERQAQRWRLAAVALAAFAFAAYRARGSTREWLWLLATLGAFWLAHHGVLGDFDYTVINRKEVFVPRAFLVVALATTAAVGLNLALAPKTAPDALSARLFSALVLVMIASAGHVLVYGWPLGFPLPPQPLRYLPFFLPFAQVMLAVAWAITGARVTAPIRS